VTEHSIIGSKSFGKDTEDDCDPASFGTAEAWRPALEVAEGYIVTTTCEVKVCLCREESVAPGSTVFPLESTTTTTEEVVRIPPAESGNSVGDVVEVLDTTSLVAIGVEKATEVVLLVGVCVEVERRMVEILVLNVDIVFPSPLTKTTT
jgi:hypothetical protein